MKFTPHYINTLNMTILQYQKRILDYFEKNCRDFDAFNYSDLIMAVYQNLYQNILDYVRTKNKLFTDSQLSSQIGDITRFTNAYLFKQNMK